jgi:hypothetical protein
MNDTVLKREFNHSTINRLRNLIRGEYDEKTIKGVGYTPKYENKTEGDIWEEDGRTWTIKKGVRRTVNKLNKARKYNITPLICPNCNNQMKLKFDKDYYRIHRKCFNCVIEFETELKKEGLWEEYHNKIANSEIDNFINNYRIWVVEQLKDNNKSFITEQGDVENWDGGINKSKILEELDKTIEHLKSLRK